ncbi:hypothetical protein Ndes2526B_g01839 [Nannochloris sp. 'desiccata']
MQQSKSAGQELHKRRIQPDDSEVDPVVAQLGEDCSKLYAKLEECLCDNDRDWRACQKEVQALRSCHEKKNSLSSLPSSPPPS